jgi:uncharacterized RDD family membrane protein YckC
LRLRGAACLERVRPAVAARPISTLVNAYIEVATLATLGNRAVAAVIDALILLVPAAVLGVVLGDGAAGAGADVKLIAVMLIVWIAYCTAFEAIVGATPGKRQQRLLVVATDGGRLSWQRILVRNLARLVDGLLFYGVGAVVASASPIRQRLGDRLAQTIVVDRKAYEVRTRGVAFSSR